MTEEEIFIRANKKVKAKKGFFVHFGVFCATVLFLFTINFLTSPKFWWFLFPTLGWGIGIVAHYIGVFGISDPSVEDWENKELEKEMRKIKRQFFIEPESKNVPLPDDKLELKEFKKLRNEWEDKDFV
ncbi:2TM domain-containing protein [Saprospiraceae bacterium]|nr:2TM domain-containing protein [bacterium]MDB4443560.1 2TM domain-containing protein [Saprospiraceae bacterium]MDC3210593.1 2TM domain-containing protein [Saprospiraceae bacterium]MDG1435108.1 2TM domain-containing protein [Saprospiraceae bacterium]